VSLVARYLEENGMPTVIIGSALDIVENCSVPRFLFVDFPLGNPCGKPWDPAMQQRIVSQGINLFETIHGPQDTVHSPEKWGDDDWRDHYMAVNDNNRDELARKGEALRQGRSNRERRQV
jgi:D-proline reductase (dithiol) PrdB